MWASPDGITWSLLPDESLPGSAYVFSVAGGGPGFVAVGVGYEEKVEHDYTPVRPMVWTSPDGINWSMVPNDEGAFGVPDFNGPLILIADVTSGGPGLVAVGFEGWDSQAGVPGNAVVWTSPDGIKWTRIPHDPAVFGVHGSGMFSVMSGGPGLVAVGEFEGSPGVWTSPDGINWSAHPNIEFQDRTNGVEMSDVAVGGPGLVAVGRIMHKAAVWTSPDGETWTLVPWKYNADVLGGPTDRQRMNAVVAVGDDLVAVGSSVWTSSDGITWSRIDVELSGEMESVVIGEHGLVAVGSADDAPAVWIAQPEE
jgi:hypothetical protein